MTVFIHSREGIRALCIASFERVPPKRRWTSGNSVDAPSGGTDPNATLVILIKGIDSVGAQAVWISGIITIANKRFALSVELQEAIALSPQP
jgi:hypothetical protein